MAIPAWTRTSHTMRFARLDATDGSFPIYTIGWRFLDGEDEWSRRFTAYKFEQSVASFNGGSWLLKLATKDILDDRCFEPENTALINALGSQDTAPNTNATLYRTTKWIGEQRSMPFLTQLLRKQQHRPLKSLGGAGDRDGEVMNKYICENIPGNIQNVIIIDDLVTRGATFREVKRAIESSTGGLNFAALAIAKNERKSYAEACGTPIENSNISDKAARLWQNAEERFK